MRILIRLVGTESYLAPNGHWGTKVSAREFLDLQAAGHEALQLEDAEVLLSYDNPPCDLALNPAYCANPRKRL
jgi:hypothetical protein